MKPIIFSTPMVKAILAGHKTMTRRVIKPQPVGEIRQDATGDYGEDYGGGVALIKSPYKTGDVLWVRETWDCAPPYLARDRFWDIRYAADGEQAMVEMPETFNPILYKPHRWRPSIHMPREAARIFLKITDVRAERLGDISTADAIAEGVATDLPTGLKYENHIDAFAQLWDSINVNRPEYRWDKNPWVWVISFERKEEP